ncbi:MAG: hypothetical protein ACRETL_12045 [Gammaproteobacteria bacterium]
MRTRIPRPPRWRAPFLRMLAKTGNVKLSAERAPVHYTHVYRLRRKDAEFAAAWDAARANAAERLGGSRSPLLDKCTGDAIRGELVLFRTRAGKAHLRPPRANGWTRAKEKAFLDALASTCVVTIAARIAGVTPSAAYQRRLRWPGFAAEWKIALKNGVQALELRLLHDACEHLDDPYVGIPLDLTVRSVDDAISVLAYHKKQMWRYRPAWNTKPVDVEAVKAQIVLQAQALDAEAAKKRRSPCR